MMRILRAKDEAVEMVAQRYRFLPHVFRWRGRCCEVEAVERCWTDVGRRKAVRCFQVQCSAGSFELCQDLSSGAWRLRRAVVRPVVRRNRHSRPAKVSLRRSGRRPGRSSLGDMRQRLSAATGVWPTRRVRSAGGG